MTLPPVRVAPARALLPANPWFWAVWSTVAAFGAYFCMYGFRRPYVAASYPAVDLAGHEFNLKVLLVTAQTVGYAVSKFLGVKFIAECPPSKRALGILALIGIAELGLVLYGVLPLPWNAFGLFVNGLMLGMVFGLVLGFLEGRQATEALAAGLCASFILADGVMKSVGQGLLEQGVPSAWMPALAGLLFFPPLLICTGMLACIPPPSAADEAARSARAPMSRPARVALFSRYALGLSLIVGIYLLITILRSARADFQPELWRGLGQTAQPWTFAGTELLVALGVLIVNGALVCVRDNRTAFFASLCVCGLGLAVLAAALAGYQSRLLQGEHWMVLVGLGLYLPYVAIHTTVFERFLAMTRERGNLGFLMYVADSIGYLGYVAVMLLHHVVRSSDNLLDSFLVLGWLVTLASAGALVGCGWYFAKLPTTFETSNSLHRMATTTREG